MRAKIALKAKCMLACCARRGGLALRLAVCAISIALATALAGIVYDGYLIWVANGVLLAYLLLAPRNRWPAYLCAGLLGHLAGNVLIHTPWQLTAIVAPLDVGEALLSASLLRPRSAILPRFTSGAYIIRFLAFAVLAVPLTTAFFGALLQALWLHTAFGSAFYDWASADSLGACVVTPACVAIFRASLRNSLSPQQNWLYLLPFTAVAIILLSQSRVPLPFLLYPLLVLILLRLGLGSAAMAALLVAAIGSWFTVRGQGPFAITRLVSPLDPAVILQLFVASAMFMLYGISVVLENLRATERRLQQIAALHKLVMDNSRDVIIMADFEGNRSFVSAAGANWGGWSQDELLSFHSLDLVHPDDFSKMKDTILALRSGSDGALVECRARTRDGGYIWIEASLRTIRDSATGLPLGILNSIREITERKRAEQQLAEAYHAVEALAGTDALTGLANRRRFDECITTEWRRALRDRKPISLLLIDADYFKSYNDTYGHLRGDYCLKQIASITQSVILRPGDLVARFGGEEFAVILPSTPNQAAMRIAREITIAMSDRKLLHCANPLGVLTVSVGCATLFPQLGQNGSSLIECADKALYEAKRAGRNRACNYNAQDASSLAGAQPGATIEPKTA